MHAVICIRSQEWTKEIGLLWFRGLGCGTGSESKHARVIGKIFDKKSCLWVSSMELIQIMEHWETCLGCEQCGVVLCCLDTWREVCQESRFSRMVSCLMWRYESNMNLTSSRCLPFGWQTDDKLWVPPNWSACACNPPTWHLLQYSTLYDCVHLRGEIWANEVIRKKKAQGY